MMSHPVSSLPDAHQIRSRNGLSFMAVDFMGSFIRRRPIHIAVSKNVKVYAEA
jgi:hypothetical protein